MNNTNIDRRFHSLRVAMGLLRISIITRLQYRTDAFTSFINILLECAMSVISIAIVYSQVDSLRGWDADGLLLVLGVFFILRSIVRGIVHSSISILVNEIRTGNFDYRLLKPVDSQILSVVQRIEIWHIFDFILGLGLVVFSLIQLGTLPSVAQIAACTLLLVAASLLIAAFWSLISSITFWTIQGEFFLWTLDDMYEHLRWPITIFPPALRYVLSSAYPLGLAMTLPASALTGRLDLQPTLWMGALIVIFFALSRLMWNAGIRKYEGASS